MKLHILGSGTCEPSPDRTPACYFLKTDFSRMLIDPGPGAVNRMAAIKLDPFDIDAIVLTHFHLDHMSDLLYWLFAYKNCDAHNKKDVTLIGPDGFKTFFDRISEPFSEWIFLPEVYGVNVIEISGKSWSAGDLTLSATPMNHGAGAVGYRFETDDGVSLAYSGDTGPCDQLISIAKGAQALLVELSKPDEWEGEGHMRPIDVANAGIDSGVGKIILTHISPVIDTSSIARLITSHGYKGEVVVGEDQMVIDL